MRTLRAAVSGVNGGRGGLLSVFITEFSLARVKRAGTLPLADEAHPLIEIGGQFVQRGTRREWLAQRLAGYQAAQEFGGRRALRRGLLGDDDGGESHGGL